MIGQIKKSAKEHWAILQDGTITMFKEFFKKETNKKQRANMWTFSRIIIPVITTILIIVASITNSIAFIISSIALIGLGGISDFFDGRSARKYNSTSEFGKFLDQVADKWFTSILAIDLSILNPNFIYLLIGESSISLVNLVYKAKYPEIQGESSIIGKVKQWPLFSTLFLGFLSKTNSTINLISKILFTLTISLQTLATIDYIKINRKKVSELKTKKLNMVEKKDLVDKKEKTSTLKNEKSVELTKKQQYIMLRDILLQINEKRINEEKTIQKQKIKNDSN